MALDWSARLHNLIICIVTILMTFLWILHKDIFSHLASCLNTEVTILTNEAALIIIDEESWKWQHCLFGRRMIYYEYDEDIHMSHGTNSVCKVSMLFMTDPFFFRFIILWYSICFCWKLLLLDVLLTIKTEADAMVQRLAGWWAYTGRYFWAALPRFDTLAVRLEAGLYCFIGKLDLLLL